MHCKEASLSSHLSEPLPPWRRNLCRVHITGKDVTSRRGMGTSLSVGPVNRPLQHQSKKGGHVHPLHKEQAAIAWCHADFSSQCLAPAWAQSHTVENRNIGCCQSQGLFVSQDQQCNLLDGPACFHLWQPCGQLGLLNQELTVAMPVYFGRSGRLHFGFASLRAVCTPG